MSFRKIDGVLIDADTLDGVQEATLATETEVATAVSDEATARDLAIAAAMPEVKLETKDMTQASGDVSYTGYGFLPTGFIVFATVGTAGSVGHSGATLVMWGIYKDFGQNYHMQTTYLIQMEPASGSEQKATISSYDVAGFTLTWTKVGTPTGTANLNVFAFA